MKLETGYRGNYSGICDIDYNSGGQLDSVHLLGRKERP